MEKTQKGVFMKKSAELRKGGVTDPFTSLRSSINEIFDNWFDECSESMSGLRPLRLIKGEALTQWPRVDLVEENNEVVVTAEIPGFAEKDIELNVSSDLLTIKGVRSEDGEEEDKSYYLRERYLGTFERAIPLPVDVDVSRCESAEFKNGLLIVRLPKSREQNKQPHKVEIRSV